MDRRGNIRLFKTPHQNWMLESYAVQQNWKNALIYSTLILGWVKHEPLGIPVIWQVRCAFGVNESGANGSNYTRVQFRVGSLATYTEIADLNTQGNPAAGTVLRNAELEHYPAVGDALFVVVSRTGTLSVDMALEPFTASFELGIIGGIT